jgi:hypothetical protein
MEERDRKRLTLDFDLSAYDLLEELALQSGKTKAGVVRTVLYAVAQEEERRHKNKLAVVDENGKQLKQLIITRERQANQSESGNQGSGNIGEPLVQKIEETGQSTQKAA